MEHVQKMFLVPQQELDKLKQNASALPLDTPIRKIAESTLDSDIQKLLSTPSIDMHEKAKMYSNILQRYLSFVKQGTSEKNVLTLSLPGDNPPGTGNTDFETVQTQSNDGGDTVIADILKHMPAKNKKNATHIVDTISKSKDKLTWTPRGELVIDGSIVHGSHVYDLLKNVTSTYRVDDAKRPLGWLQFLEKLAIMNVPLSAVPNGEVKQAIVSIKRSGVSQPRKSNERSDVLATPKRSRGRSRTRRMLKPWLTY